MAYVYPRPEKKKGTPPEGSAAPAGGKKPKARKPKKPIWMMGYTDSKGKPRQKSSGLRDERAALAKAEQIEQRERDIRDGVRPVITGRGVLFKDIAQKYIESALPLLESSPQEKGRIYNHLLPAFGDRLASSILPSELDQLFAKLLAEGQSHASVRKIRSRLSMIYKYAIRALRMRDLENPVKDANDIPVIKRKPTPIPLSWIEPLLSNVSRHYYPLFVTALFTGMRKGELAGLRLRDVELETRMIHVTRSYGKATTKGRKDRHVGIHVRLVPLLQNHIEERRKAGAGAEDPLFTVEDIGQRDWKRKDGTPHGKRKRDDDWSITTDSDLPDLMRAALKKAGIVDGFQYTCRRGASGRARWGCGYKARENFQDPDLVCPECGRLGLWIEPIPVTRAFKDLRSTFGTWLAKTSGNIRAATVLLGHSDVKVTEDSYALLEAADLLEDVDKLPFAFVERPALASAGGGGPVANEQPPAPYAFLTPKPSERGWATPRASNSAAISGTSSVRAEGIEPTTYGLRVHGKASNTGKTRVAGGSRPQQSGAKTRVSPPPPHRAVAPGSRPQPPSPYAFLTPPTARPQLTVHEGGGEKLLTPEDVAELLGVCRDTVYRAIKRRELTVSRFGSATIRIRWSDLEAFLARNASTPTTKGKP